MGFRKAGDYISDNPAFYICPLAYRAEFGGFILPLSEDLRKIYIILLLYKPISLSAPDPVDYRYYDGLALPRSVHPSNQPKPAKTHVISLAYCHDWRRAGVTQT